MIKIGSTEVDTIKIGANGVDSIMLNGVQIYPTATGFAITQHPRSQAAEVGDPATDYPFSVKYTPPEATVQWEWCNDGEGGCTNFSPIDGATDDTYIPVPSNGSDIVIGQKYDHFRAVVSLDGEPDIESDAAILSVELGDVQEMTGDAKTFLDSQGPHYYSGMKPAGWNKSMESLPADELFPYGQKMPIVAHNIVQSLVATSAAHGINAGYRQNAYDYGGVPDGLYNAIDAAGMKYMGYLQKVRWGDISDGSAPARAEAEMQQYLDDPRLDIYGWVLPYDDQATDYYTNDVTAVKAVNDAINAKHPAPLGALGTGDTILTGNFNSVLTGYTSTIQQTYAVGPQCVPTKAKYNGLEQILTYKAPILVGLYANSIVNSINNSDTGEPWLTPFMEIQAYTVYEGNNPAHLNNTYYKSYMTHNILLGLIGGCNSLWWYQMDPDYPARYCTTTSGFVDQGYEDILDLIKIITDHKLDRAFLWGTGAKPATMQSGQTLLATYTSGNPTPVSGSITTGPTGSSYKANWGTWSTSSNKPTGGGTVTMSSESQLSYRDLQLNNDRFVVATNSNRQDSMADYYGLARAGSEGEITATFTGFPNDGTQNQLKAVDLLTGTEYPISAAGVVTVVMPAMSSVILKLGAAEGWIYPQ